MKSHREMKRRKRWRFATKTASGEKLPQKTVRAHTKSEARAFLKMVIDAPIPTRWMVVEVTA